MLFTKLKYSWWAVQGSHKGALKSYATALVETKKLAKNDPNNNDLQQKSATLHFKMGNMLAHLGDPNGARMAITEGLAITERLTANKPDDQT